MWDLQSRWFDLALIMAIFAFGNVVFGHFEEHKPKWQRVLKVVVFTAVFVSLSATVGRGWALGFLGVFVAAAAWVHLWWLPHHGVNGLTGEPKERYRELIRRRGKK